MSWVGTLRPLIEAFRCTFYGALTEQRIKWPALPIIGLKEDRVHLRVKYRILREEKQFLKEEIMFLKDES